MLSVIFHILSNNFSIIDMLEQLNLTKSPDLFKD